MTVCCDRTVVMPRGTKRPLYPRVLASLAGWALGASALAGGSPERTLLIIDPTSAESMYIGNYYKNARNIPDSNIVYMTPGAINYQAFVAQNQAALLGTLEHRLLDDHIDQIVISACDVFFINAPNLVFDACVSVNRFSLTGAYTIMPISSDVLAGVEVIQRNGYFKNSLTPRAYSAQTGWSGGGPSTSGDKSFLVATLGYLGERGNTTTEILDLIDRSVSADGSFPAGTFYYMRTNDVNRSGPRHDLYPAATSAIISLGGNAQHITSGQVLPDGNHDILGIMTGAATPNIDGANITILPGAFCDHLTSWAATFDKSQQTKVSPWIVKGASASWGAVEEPCNYPGKFPIANMHVNYFQGLSLGEAIFRSVSFVPFQGLLYGDPLTRPYTHIPVVDMPDLPSIVDGSAPLFLAYTGTTTHPTANVSVFELFVDGDKISDVLVPFPLILPAHLMTEGWHEVRLLGKDSTSIKSAGAFVGSFEIVRTDATVALEATTTTGDLATPFSFTLDASGEDIVEVRLVSNGRVLAATTRCNAVVTVYGSNLGAGPVRVQAEALRADGSVMRSSPIDLDIAFAPGTPAGIAPVAFDYSKRVLVNEPILVELPVSSDEDPASLSFTVLSGPTQATLVAGAGGFLFLTPNPGALGTDTISYRVDGPGGSSNIATVTILYNGYSLDLNADGSIGVDDLHELHINLVDVNLDGVADAEDLRFLERIIRCDEAKQMNAGRR